MNPPMQHVPVQMLPPITGWRISADCNYVHEQTGLVIGRMFIKELWGETRRHTFGAVGFGSLSPEQKEELRRATFARAHKEICEAL